MDYPPTISPRTLRHHHTSPLTSGNQVEGLSEQGPGEGALGGVEVDRGMLGASVVEVVLSSEEPDRGHRAVSAPAMPGGSARSSASGPISARIIRGANTVRCTRLMRSDRWTP